MALRSQDRQNAPPVPRRHMLVVVASLVAVARARRAFLRSLPPTLAYAAAGAAAYKTKTTNRDLRTSAQALHNIRIEEALAKYRGAFASVPA